MTGLARFFALSVLAGLLAAAAVVGTGVLVARADEPVPVVEVTEDAVPTVPSPDPVEDAGLVVTYALDPSQFAVFVIAGALVVVLLAAQLVSGWGK